jgi:hypothetical protein
MRSRTPNTNNVQVKTINNTIQYTSNDYDSVVSSNYGARSHRKFVKRDRKYSMAGTMETSKIIDGGPGPGSYDTNSVRYMKNGPRATIGNSLRGTQDSTTIPGPDQYSD